MRRQTVKARVLSAISKFRAICETFTQRVAAQNYMARRRNVMVFVGGTGNPLFHNRLRGAALRAAEMGCDAILKATQVDGIYSADPKTEPGRPTRFDKTLPYEEVLQPRT